MIADADRSPVSIPSPSSPAGLGEGAGRVPAGSSVGTPSAVVIADAAARGVVSSSPSSPASSGQSEGVVMSGSLRNPVPLVEGVDRTSGAPVVVLGIGNPIMGDDGIGLALFEGLQARCGDLPGVDWVNGVTDGMELLPVVQDARYLLVLDAVAGGNEYAPGEVRHLVGDQVPRLLSTKLSPHQVGLLDILAAARLLGKEPEAIEIVGVVPELVDLSTQLTDKASTGVDNAIPAAEQALRDLLSRAQQVA